MAPIHYRPEPNPLTTPSSYKLRFIPQDINGYDEVAAAVSSCPEEPQLARRHGQSRAHGWQCRSSQDILTNGIQVTYEDAFTYRPTLYIRLDTPNDPLPPMDELLPILTQGIHL